MIESPDDVGWYSWYVLLRSGSLELPTLVGAGGFFGPPNVEGVVEIGYSVVSAFAGKDYATELVGALVEHAFQMERVTRIGAHTTRDNIGSGKVLEKTGFHVVGIDPANGTVEYLLQRPIGKRTCS